MPKLNQLLAHFKALSQMKTYLVSFVLVLSFVPNFTQPAYAAQPLKVCAVPQLYPFLTALQKQSRVAFTAEFATVNELYAKIANSPTPICDVLMSSEERLAISLIRSNKAVASSMLAFARAPLVFWSNDPYYFNDMDAQTALRTQFIQSIALPKANLTPVGFASHQVLKRRDFPTQYLKSNIYRAEQEYQVYSLVDTGNIDCGIVTKPLIVSVDGRWAGSYWEIPSNYYDAIQYYVVLFESSKDKPEAKEFTRYLLEDAQVAKLLKSAGFIPLYDALAL